MTISKTQIERLIKKGRKERSEALLLALHGFWTLALPKPRAKQVGAASKQSCPN